MPELQAQLALYGAIDEALVEHYDPVIARTVEQFLPGTTGFGQRGWYREALGFLDNLAGPGKRMAPPGLEAARRELLGFARSGTGLPAAVTARSIFAEVVLENIARLREGPKVDTLGPLSDMLSVAPTPSLEDSSDQPGLVGEDGAARLATAIQQTVSTKGEYTAFMNRQRGDKISDAVATYDPNAFLRKVRDEYCSVITTDATWSDISFEELMNIADPQNWDEIYHGFFCSMTLRGETLAGWSAVLEQVSGDCTQYSMTTPLKFWKEYGADHLLLNYDLDDEHDDDGGRFVLVDNGYIWITRVGGGVRIRTSKELLIHGLSSTATTALAGGLGWADNASGMFRHGAQFPCADPVKFTNSMPKAAALTLTRPRATSFPIDPPVLPADIRAEGVNDTVDILKACITNLASFGSEAASRWSNGVDARDVHELGTRLGAIVTDTSVAVFDTMSSNFRPAPIPQEETDG
jgi:hypothetical protein